MPSPEGILVRAVSEPDAVRGDDDVLLFLGDGMAQELSRFSRAAVSGSLPPVVVFAPRLDWHDVTLALELGANGYLLENRYGELLLPEALRCASQGGSFLDPAITVQQVRAAARVRARKRNQSVLSPQERQLMELLASGLSLHEMAARSHLGEKTVRNRLSRIYGRLDVRNRSEAILYWLGYLSPQDVGSARLGGA